MQIITILDAVMLLYLKKRGDGTAPDMTEFLEARGVPTTANYLALALRRLEARGLIELIGSGPKQGGPAPNLWALTPMGKKETVELSRVFDGLFPLGKTK